MSHNYLDELNSEQREVATTLSGHMLVVAGAGTGKTRSLVCRVAYMIDEGIDPSNILLLTFTKKAAMEMKDRICTLIGSELGNRISAQTFHSFCAEQLRHYARYAGIPADYTIISEDDAQDIIAIFSRQQKEYYKINDMKIEKFPSDSEILNVSSRALSSLSSVQLILANDEYVDIDEAFHFDVKQIIEKFRDYKKQHNMLDFDDIIFTFHSLLINNESIRAQLDEKYTYIMCDEYQDTNIIQDRLLDLLSKDHPNLCVVGDPFQSIYSWRCAEIENIITFAERHPGTKTIRLFRNYRSSQQILDYANAMISHSKEGIHNPLIGISSGIKPQINIYPDDKVLAKEVITDITDKLSQGIPASQICVMGRNGRSTFYVEAELTKNRIPYAKFGGRSFFSFAIIRDILAFLKARQSTLDELSWLRILAMLPGIASRKAHQIYQFVQEYELKGLLMVPPSILKNIAPLLELKTLMDDMDGAEPSKQISLAKEFYLRTRRDVISSRKTTASKIDELLRDLDSSISMIDTLENMAESYVSSKEMLEDFALNIPIDKKDDEKICVTTIHSAKGLEYDVVYLINPIMGVFPRNMQDTKETREDQRCMYVAITRPKDELIICMAESVEVFGRYTNGILSSFLAYRDVLENIDHQDNIDDYLPFYEHDDIIDIDDDY